MIRKLREADTMLAVGKTIGQVIQTLEIGEQTFHRWRNQYGGMKAEATTKANGDRSRPDWTKENSTRTLIRLVQKLGQTTRNC